MPILNKMAQIAAKPLPHSINPKAHAVVDYVNIGACLIAAASFWKRNRRAAAGALISGGAALIINLLTDYPGGMKKVITFATHRRMDFGLAAMIATMPEFLAFEDHDERKFFLAEGILISAISEMTPAPRGFFAREKSRREAA